MLLGAGAGGVGRLLLRYRQELTIAAGAFVALSGLVVAGVIHLPKPAVVVAPHAGAGGAFLTGAALAIGWTPCVGYVLGAILTMAASSQSVWTGSLLLLAYSIGLGVPLRARRPGLRLDDGAPLLHQAPLPVGQVRWGRGVGCCFVFGVLLMQACSSGSARLLPAFASGGR